MQRAKSNIIKKYLVIGIIEQIEDFFSVLEKLVPSFFKGLKTLYKSKYQVKFESKCNVFILKSASMLY